VEYNCFFGLVGLSLHVTECLSNSFSLKGAEARYNKDLTLCRAKVNEFEISEVKYESLFNERITTIKKREKQLIDGITKHSEKLQNEIELERKTVRKTFCDMKLSLNKDSYLTSLISNSLTFARQRVKSLL
jgi:hypothetical protein